jgi:hypothetical protein
MTTTTTTTTTTIKIWHQRYRMGMGGLDSSGSV